MAGSAQLKTVLSSKIAGILRQEIYENTIKVGAHLNEAAIAARLGTSRGPLRDAIHILENEGLVKTPPNGRTFVVGFSTKEIIEYYELRYYLESKAIHKILSEPENQSYHDWLNDLEQLLSESKQYLKYDDKDLFTTADYKFHLSIHTRANNTISIQVWKMLANMSITIIEMNKRYLADKYIHDLNATFEYHDKILLSLKNRDLDMALKNLQIHLQKGKETFLKIIESVANMTSKSKS
ncbi:MAG: GntR family transcriptional regulator [Actinobacteria bacterium]|nr:GntR family transcriptional regulator [Actinomycetota bacterium]MCG2788711.1 GntR family transcriptional regulator [Actinomycetes bacterium]